ncbi:MAG TPA: chaperone NapD [Nitrospirota bacterium]|nr:chaperone NapD [Nitrospirota bacterium]
MAVASMVVEIEEGAAAEVLARIACLKQANVFGVKENQLVVVLEGDTMEDIDNAVQDLWSIDSVTGVYPVFAGVHDEKAAETARRPS